MKQLRRLVPLALLALALATPARAADDHHDRNPDDPFRLQPLRGGVYALYGRGGNIGFFVGPKSVLMIDDQFGNLAEGIKARITGVTDKPIKFLVNTHHHGDHVGGNAFFSQFAEVIGQDNVRVRMLEGPREVLRNYPADLDTLKTQLAAERDTTKIKSLKKNIAAYEDAIATAKTVKIEDIAPFLTFTQEMRVYLGDETIRLIHVGPAHTDGDCAVYFVKANVVHMGDCYFHKVIPYIDQKHGGSVPGYLAFIDAMVGQVPADATFIPGHGEVSGLDGLQEFRQYIQDLRDLVAAEKKKGGKLEDAKTTLRLEKYKDWSGYADRFKDNVEAAWNSLP